MSAFNELDKERFGFVDSECFELFMEDINMDLTEDLLEALMRRIDQIGNGKLNYTNFVDNICNFEIPSLKTFTKRSKSLSKSYSK